MLARLWGIRVCYFWGKASGGKGLHTHLYRPYSRPGAQVEHALRIVADGRAVQLSVAAQRQAVVEEVEPVVLVLVVGEEVGAILEGVVAAAVLVLVARDAGLQRRGDGLGRVAVRGVVVVGVDLLAGWSVVVQGC